MTIEQIIPLISIIAVIISLLTTILTIRYYKKSNKQLRKIFNFGDDDLVIIMPLIKDDDMFSHRFSIGGTFVREGDIMAFQHLQSAIIKSGWKKSINFVNPNKLGDDAKSKNLIMIGPPFIHPASREIIKYLHNHKIKFYDFRVRSNREKMGWQLTDGDSIFQSEYYSKILRGSNSEINAEDLRIIKDYATVTKVSNPLNTNNKIFIFAGITHIGSAAAAKLIDNKYLMLYEKLGKLKTIDDFSIVISCSYIRGNIVDIKILGLHPIPKIIDRQTEQA
jgi:hypothetical protein